MGKRRKKSVYFYCNWGGGYFFLESIYTIEKQVQRAKPRAENRFDTLLFYSLNRGCETGFLSKVYLSVLVSL